MTFEKFKELKNALDPIEYDTDTETHTFADDDGDPVFLARYAEEIDDDALLVAAATTLLESHSVFVGLLNERGFFDEPDDDETNKEQP